MKCKICNGPIDNFFNSKYRVTCGTMGCQDAWALRVRNKRIAEMEKRNVKPGKFRWANNGRDGGVKEKELDRPLTWLLAEDGWRDYVGCNL